MPKPKAKTKPKTAKAKTNGSSPPAAGDNINPTVRAVAAGIKRIYKLVDQRQSVNADIRAEREKIVAMGVNRHALAAAMSVAKLDVEQRKGFDFSYDVARRAAGLPVQGDMFDNDAADTAKDAASGGKPGKKAGESAVA